MDKKILIGLGVLVVLVAGLSLKVAADNNALATGLVGYWTFNSSDVNGATVSDTSGNSNNGTLTNGAQLAPGKVKQALITDGTNDYVNVPDSPTLGLTTDGSIAFWFQIRSQPTNPASGAGYILASKGSYFYTTPNGYAISYIRNGYCPNGYNSYQIRMDIGNGTSYSAPGLCTTLELNRWYHVAGTWTPSSAYLYLDGVQVGGGAGTTVSPTNNSFPLTIGTGPSSTSPDEFVPGLIDEVRVYNRALSADQVARLAAQSLPPKTESANKANLVGYWSFDAADINGTTALDGSGTGNNGTLTNGPTNVAGKIKEALSFDGTNDYVTVPDNPTLDLSTDGSIAFWFQIRSQPTNPATGAGYVLVSKGSYFYGTPNGYEIEYIRNGYCPNGYNSYQIRMDIGDGTSYSTAGQCITLDLNRWYHVAATWTSGSQPSLYLDGALVGGGSPGTITFPTNNTYPLVIGSGPSSTSLDEFLPGLIDEVRIYNRALSASQVQSLFNGTNKNF